MKTLPNTPAVGLGLAAAWTLVLSVNVLFWLQSVASIAWFTGVVASGVGLASQRVCHRTPLAAEWLGLVVVVAQFMNIAVSAAAYAMAGEPTVWPVMSGAVGLILWILRPKG